MPDSAVKVDKNATKASYSVRRLQLFDHYDLVDALAGGPADRATCSFDVTWKATGKPFKLRDEENRLVGDFHMAQSTIEWESQGSGFSFRSDPAQTSSTVFAMIGLERNGEYFS